MEPLSRGVSRCPEIFRTFRRYTKREVSSAQSATVLTPRYPLGALETTQSRTRPGSSLPLSGGTSLQPNKPSYHGEGTVNTSSPPDRNRSSQTVNPHFDTVGAKCKGAPPLVSGNQCLHSSSTTHRQASNTDTFDGGDEFFTPENCTFGNLHHRSSLNGLQPSSRLLLNTLALRNSSL